MTTDKKTYFVLDVKSESGDSHGPFLFGEKPNDVVLLRFLRAVVAADDIGQGDGPGWKGTYLHLTWSTGKPRR